MENPYNKQQQEAKYHTWQAGFDATTKDDNPYTSQTDPELNAVWMEGWSSNMARKTKKRAKPTLEQALAMEQEDEFGPVNLNEVEPDLLPKKNPNKSLAELEDHVLLTELKNRKRKELAQLEAENKDILDRINKLKLFLEL